MGRRATLALASSLAFTLVLAGASCTSAGHATRASATTPIPSSAGGAGTYVGHGVTFRYPSGWHELELTGASASAGHPLWSATVGPGGSTLISVSVFTLRPPVNASNLDARTQAIALQVRSLFVQAGGHVTAGPSPRTLAGLPGLSFDGIALDPDGSPVLERVVLAFGGTTEYQVSCQSDAEARREMLAACDRVLGTFALAS